MTLTEARRRLIIKAALQWARQDGPQIAKIKMNAYGQVAADVLGMCMTPDAFEMAVKDALSICPRPYLNTGTRERTAEKRAAWEAEIVRIVLWLLADIRRRVSQYKTKAVA